MSTATPPQQPAIEKRVATLEQQMAELLRAHPAGNEASAKSWVSTVGTWKDDNLSREADQLGEAWRKSVTD
jgi:hypothetical protein